MLPVKTPIKGEGRIQVNHEGETAEIPVCIIIPVNIPVNVVPTPLNTPLRGHPKFHVTTTPVLIGEVDEVVVDLVAERADEDEEDEAPPPAFP